MKITWLGQAGLVIESNSTTVIVDPYLSDSVKALDPQKYRRVPVDEALFDIKPDLLLFTHNHLDHYDPEMSTTGYRYNDRYPTVTTWTGGVRINF